jgi:hypothetical protein
VSPPPVPLMSITVQPASGKPRVIVMDEAGLAALIMDAADALAAMAAASAVLAPAGEHPYPEPLPRREPHGGNWQKASDGKPGIPCDCGRRLSWPQLHGPDVTCPDCGAVYEHDGITIGGGARLKTLGALPGEPVTGAADEPAAADAAAVIAESIRTGRPVIVEDDEIITAPTDPGWPYEHMNRLSCGCTFAGPLTWPAGRKARCDSHGEVTTVDTDPSGDGGEPPAPAELTEDEARQPCDRKACGHERGHHAKGTEECAHGCGCAAYLLPMPAPAAAGETEDAP